MSQSHDNPYTVNPDAVNPDTVNPDAVNPDAVNPPDVVNPTDVVIPDVVNPTDAVKPDDKVILTKTREQIINWLEKQIINNTLHNTLPDSFYKEVKQGLLAGNRTLGNLNTFITTIKGNELETISDGNIRVLINEYLLKLTIPKKRANAILNMYTFNQKEINDMFATDECKLINMEDIISFIVFGCKLSTDIDVALVVKTYKLCGGKFPNLSDDALEYIKSRLKARGYDTVKRGVDIVIICVDDKNIIGVSKGGKEIANLIAFTRDAHIQDMTLPQVQINPTKYTDDMLNDKIKACAKSLLVHLCTLLRGEDYKSQETKEIKASAFGDDTKLCEAMHNQSIIEKIIFDCDTAKMNGLNLIEFHNTWKTLIMKLLQIIQLHYSDKTYYHKEELAYGIKNMKCFDSSVDDALIDEFVQGALWYLFRGTRGAFCLTLFPTLHNIYCRIFKDMLDNSKLNSSMVYIKIDDKYDNGIIANEAFDEFTKSPVIVTPEFTVAWESKYEKRSISDIFMMGVTTAESCIEELRKLQISEENISKLIACLWFIQQRSAEWLEILSSGKLICGKNSTQVDPDDTQAVYNLIRGALTELIVIEELISTKQCDPHTHKLFDEIRRIIGNDNIFCLSVGFIGKKDNSCKGCAPDLIIFCKDKIIPVEIKTLKFSDHNSDWRRAVSLAKKQNIRTQDILFENGVYIKIEYSLIILCSWGHGISNRGILNVEIIKQNM